MKRLLFVGDISIDLTLTAPHFPQPDEKVHCSDAFESIGGVAANAAVAARRAGAEVTLAAQLGTDAASGSAAARLEGEGVRLHIGQRDGAICRVVTIVEPHGEKRLLLHPGVSLYPDAEVLSGVDLASIDHLHTAIYGSSAFALLERARAARLSWSLDLEPATFPGGIAAFASVIDGAAVVFLNERAAAIIGEDAIDRLLAMGAETVLHSQGPRGATLHRRGTGRVAHAPAPRGLPIIDTTGAGDCLAGWYLAALGAGESPAHALALAVTAATMACGALGAQSAMPTRETVLSYKED